MTRQDPERPGPRRPAKDPHRTAAFREAARAIVFKDRDDRRVGFSVNTAGTIARALERAYVQGQGHSVLIRPCRAPAADRS